MLLSSCRPFGQSPSSVLTWVLKLPQPVVLLGVPRKKEEGEHHERWPKVYMGSLYTMTAGRGPYNKAKHYESWSGSVQESYSL